MDSKDLALSFLASIQAQSIAETVQPPKVKRPVGRPRKEQATALPNQAGEIKLPQETKAENSEPKVRVSVPSIPLPPVGSLDAKGYLKASVRARTRDERIQAIAGFIGWDHAIPLGIQEFQAKSKAQRELHPVSADGPSREEIKQAQREVKGWVPGLPDLYQKNLENCQGRISMAIDSAKEHRKQANELSGPPKDLHSGLAELEEERISFIQGMMEK